MRAYAGYMGEGCHCLVAAFFGAKQAGLGSLLQEWRLEKSCSWSKASWIGKLAPRVGLGEKL